MSSSDGSIVQDLQARRTLSATRGSEQSAALSGHDTVHPKLMSARHAVSPFSDGSRHQAIRVVAAVDAARRAMHARCRTERLPGIGYPALL
ncbi:hypothetical protein VC273_01040 [Xanthomonas nasturtii]|uniref:hypothetical protein n=1 Tax=Xanthomonas TaxID=338 RepID=UPI0012905474|nr:MULTISPECIES: hypothetical protein [Xanthomonas]MEA9554559.1 hypothetical protein [Xanthomonas nasturtii]